jgi:hypothetical protein
MAFTRGWDFFDKNSAVQDPGLFGVEAARSGRKNDSEEKMKLGNDVGTKGKRNHMEGLTILGLAEWVSIDIKSKEIRTEKYDKVLDLDDLVKTIRR